MCRKVVYNGVFLWIEKCFLINIDIFLFSVVIWCSVVDVLYRGGGLRILVVRILFI